MQCKFDVNSYYIVWGIPVRGKFCTCSVQRQLFKKYFEKEVGWV
jgi:hypothetical protein